MLGDVATGAINAMGGCVTAEVPTITVVGGTANVFRGGSNNSVTANGQELVWTSVPSVGVLIEPGVIFGTDRFGNNLSIIWPAIAGLPPGPPILRVNLASWNSWVQTGRTVDVAMTFNVVSNDGSTATYSVRANRIDVPVGR